MNVALLIPICSRNIKFSSIEEIPLFKYFMTGFNETKSDNFNYHFFIGYDDDDLYYKSHKNYLEGKGYNVYELKKCHHSPPKAWNQLFEYAYNHPQHIDYFFQIGDDVLLKTKKWTEIFINKLKEYNNIGVVGPCDFVNYNQRIANNMAPIIENSFVSRKHFEIFKFFFNPNIINWYCDNWITEVYNNKNTCSYICTNIVCSNIIRDSRYNISGCPDFNIYINDDKQLLINYLEKEAPTNLMW